MTFSRSCFSARWAAILLGAFGLSASTACASVILDFAPNGVLLKSNVNAGFEGTGSVAIDFDSNKASTVVNPVNVVLTVAANAAQLPLGGGDSKDKAEGVFSSTFEYGTPVSGATLPVDQVRFDASGTVSAVTALNAAGNPADAVFNGWGSAEFFLDAVFGGVAPSTVVGKLHLPAVRSLETWEDILQFTVTATPAPAGSPSSVVAVRNAGDSEVYVPLLADYAYKIDAVYKAQAVFGTDPPFAIGGYLPSIEAIPEPSTFAVWSLLGLSCIGVGWWRKRKAAYGPSEKNCNVSRFVHTSPKR